MKVVIIEDEPLAAEKLVRYLDKSTFVVEVIQKLASLKDAIPWVMEHQDKVDLFFMDIQLQDGLCFEIFSNVNVFKPVIFTTAFDEYAIDAFKVNSIDYLLKPISFTALNRALEKFKKVKEQFLDHNRLQPIINRLKTKGFKERFLVKKGNHIKSILTEQVTYFFAEGRDVFLVGQEGRRYLIDYKLEELEEFLDSKSFFRINRSLIVNITSIVNVIVHSNRRLKLQIKSGEDRDAVVAREKVGKFKTWFEGD